MIDLTATPDLIGHCHGQEGCREPGNVSVTYRTANVHGGGTIAPGLTLTASTCTGHRDAFVKALPGIVVLLDVREIPLPEPIRPEPVGLDAVDPAPTEPVKVRVKRRRKAAR